MLALKNVLAENDSIMTLIFDEVDAGVSGRAAGKVAEGVLRPLRPEITSTRTARITLIDSGVPFDPLMKPDPDVTLTAEQRGIGGLGIYMVKKSMDFVTYFRKNEQNTFTMVKKW